MLRLTSLLALLFLPACALAATTPDVQPRARPAVPPAHYGADALSAIRSRHVLRCGIITAAEDYSLASTHGNLSNFSADLCRATAAAVLGNRDAVSMQGHPDDAHGLQALQAGETDVLFGVTPDTASALPHDVIFAPTVFFDGQGFLVNKASGITRPEQLAGKLLCFVTGTSQETRMNEWGAATGTKFWAHDFMERGEMEAALVGGSCAAITDDISALGQMRARFHARIKDFTILPQLIAIDPYAPAVRSRDVRLNAVLTDVLSALITGEALGITAANAGEAHPGAAVLLGPTPGIAATLGMKDGWAARAIGAAGNYKEIFDRDLGAGSGFLLERGHDALWSDGGMLAAPMLR